MKLLHQNTIRDNSGLVLLRSKLRAICRRKGFAESRLNEIEIVCTEIFTNQRKYARNTGFIQIWESHESDAGIDLFAMDYGPGIPDITEAFADGYSSSGTMGKGLGTVKRFSDYCDIYSIHENENDVWHGVAVWSRFLVSKTKQQSALDVGYFLRAYQDSDDNGDAIYVKHLPSGVRWWHMDGLGHGKEAALTVQGMGSMLDNDSTVEMRFDALDHRLRGGRGAVAILAEIDVAQAKVIVSGVGDMNAWLVCNGEKRSFNFSPGILGHKYRQIETAESWFPAHALMITASDGIRSSWGLSTLPGLWRKHPQFIALMMGYLLGRSTDDNSILVVGTAQKHCED